MIYWADFALDGIGEATGVQDDPFSFDDVVARAAVGFLNGDRIRIRRGRDCGVDNVILYTDKSLSFEPWGDGSGPWWIRSSGSIAIDGANCTGAVFYCGDFWPTCSLRSSMAICAGRVAMASVVVNWDGVTVHADAVDCVACSGTMSITANNSVILTTRPGTIEPFVLASLRARNCGLGIAKSKSAFWDGGSSAYANAVFDVDASVVGGVQSTPPRWSGRLHRADFLMPWSIRDAGIVAGSSFAGHDSGLWGEPRESVGGYSVGHPRHYLALRQLLPQLQQGQFDVGTAWERKLWAKAVLLDNLDDLVAGLIEERFGGQATEALPDFERVLGLFPAPIDTIRTRRQAIAAAQRAVGGIHREYFEQIASGLDYTIGAAGDKHLYIVEDDFGPFRADYSQCDLDQIWDQDVGACMYTWKVIGTNVESDTTLQRLFQQLKTEGTEPIFEND